jgi:hypothetical protein
MTGIPGVRELASGKLSPRLLTLSFILNDSL